MAILEHLGDGIGDYIHQINHMYIYEMPKAETNHYKNMLIQGIMMNLWYDQKLCIASLHSHGCLDNVFDFILENINNIKKDFEIKRVVIGLSTLTLSPDSCTLDPQVQGRFSQFLEAILTLCQRSLEIKHKKAKQERDEDDDVFEDKDCEKEAIFEEDDEYAIDIMEETDGEDDEWDLEEDDEVDDELYDTKIDKIDEILFVRDQIG